MKDKKCVTITNAFQKSLNKYNKKPEKIQVDKSSEFYQNQWNYGYKTSSCLFYFFNFSFKKFLFNTQ